MKATILLVVACAVVAGQAALLPSLPITVPNPFESKGDEVPDLGNPRWGDAPDDDKIEEFKIELPDGYLENLKQRLNNIVLTPSFNDTDFHYGFQSETVKDLIAYWANEYDHSARLEYLNQYPQYKTNVDGLSIHYIHIKPDPATAGNKTVIPLLMLHGFPGSVREFYETIKSLQKLGPKYDFLFELVIPSLPGFGFSQGANRSGMGAAQIAVVLKNLMVKLDHSQFYVQGGDWGARIVTLMSTLFPQNVVGFHSNFCIALTKDSIKLMILSALFPDLYLTPETKERVLPVKEHLIRAIEETGFFHEQMTRPDTVGVALRDSPAGLAAWIIEKFSGLTDSDMLNCKDGCLKEKYGWDTLIDNLLFYYVPNSIGTAIRIYKESFSPEQLALGLDGIPSQVPSACANYKHESIYMTKRMIQSKFPKLVYNSIINEGGHFAALELPDKFAEDLYDGITEVRKPRSGGLFNKLPEIKMPGNMGSILGNMIDKFLN